MHNTAFQPCVFPVN